MAHFLLTPFGSAGDVNPFLWLGRLLLARGHEVEMITAPMFREFAEKSGIPFTGIGEEKDFDAIVHHPDLWKPFRGTALVLELGGKFLRPAYEVIASRVRGKETVVVSPFHQFASRLSREKLLLPLVTVHLQPACILSAYDTPMLLPGTAWFNKLPRWFKRLIFSMPIPGAGKLRPALRGMCAELGVAPPRRAVPDWMHSPDANLALFPEWFAAPQPDWPPHTTCAGFPLEDMRGQIAIPDELIAWLEEGEKPVLFSPGTGNAQAREFFRESLGACERLGRRALLGTHFVEQLPDPLPPFARRFDYLPFSELLPRVSAFVHHGGIGTVSQGLAAGVPQLIMPMGHDQPDNAMRVMRLGVGDQLLPKRFTAERVARSLDRLISSAPVAEACARTAERFRSEQPGEVVVRVLEAVRFRPASP